MTCITSAHDAVMWQTIRVKARHWSDGRDAIARHPFLLQTQRRFIQFAPEKCKEIIRLMLALPAALFTTQHQAGSASEKRAGNSLIS